VNVGARVAMPPPISPSGRQHVISHGEAQATIVEVGGGLRALRLGNREVLDGYAETVLCPDARGQVLIPWPNRVDRGQYEWDGRPQQLALSEPEHLNAIHGLVRFARWDRIGSAPDRVEMAHTLWPSPGYPFHLDLQVTYLLDQEGLTVRTTARNVGADAAPYGAGQHPYLRPASGGIVDECVLSIPADRYLPADDRGLPIGTEAVERTGYDFRTRRRIGDVALDLGFTDLIRGRDGRARVELAAPDAPPLVIWVDERYPYLQIYTGDTLPDPSRRRQALAVEPMTCPANAFATGAGVLRLEPGESVTASWGLVF
jgi:aldose 1-epimerase